ncbi:protein kinase domain-containing protein [Solirubrobacter soli]|uniref:protein kinase domain-containing protein n=1 Tax=Solirubrobacter soli TaxID=363832 RepID=UPI0004067276|nr:protein kinase [Solirubrobacter soli]
MVSRTLLAPGAVVAGYRIESVLGRGGMGVVYRASDLDLGRVIALKVIAPELLEEESIRERFLKEARSAASIEHPNVIPVYAAGERDGVAFLAMRLIDGVDLKALVRGDGPLAPARAADLVAAAAAGLDAIHRAGYVHRDVKPANVLVDRDGHVYVTDFGLAKQMLSTGAATGTGRWVGTLDYVAPEQIRSERIDARADVYALGGVLAFLLTGRVPFEREGDEAKLWAQLSDPPPEPSRHRPEVPRALDAVVARAMAKAPADRYPSAGDLGRAAVAAVAGTAPSRPERVVARGAAAPEDGVEDATVTSRPRGTPRRRRRGVVGVAVGALLASVAVAVAVVLSRGDDSPRLPRVVQTIHGVSFRPNGVVLAGGDAWVSSSDKVDLVRVDTASGHVADGPRVGSGVQDMVTDGTSVWVAAKASHVVTQIDARTGTVVRTLPFRGEPLRLALGFGSLWVGTSSTPPGANQLTRLDRTGHVVRRWTFPHGIVALTAASHRLWIGERSPPTVQRFDPATGHTTLWGKLVAPAASLSPGAGYVWATLPTADDIARADPRGGVATSAACHQPTRAVAAGGRIWIACDTDHTVTLFDPGSSKKVGAVGVPLNPYALTADARSVWVTGVGENTLTQIAYR